MLKLVLREMFSNVIWPALPAVTTEWKSDLETFLFAMLCAIGFLAVLRVRRSFVADEPVTDESRVFFHSDSSCLSSFEIRIPDWKGYLLENSTAPGQNLFFFLFFFLLLFLRSLFSIFSYLFLSSSQFVRSRSFVPTIRWEYVRCPVYNPPN